MKRIVGVGNALTDMVITLKNDDVLAEFGLAKARMFLVDNAKQSEIFDHDEIKNLPQKKLSAKLVKRVENGFLFRTLKNQYYYIRETADGIFLAAFVDDKMVINCKFTNNSVISQLSADGRFVQAFSTFNPFRCEIFFNVPDYSHPLFINVRNDDCKREIFTVNEIKKL